MIRGQDPSRWLSLAVGMIALIHPMCVLGARSWWLLDLWTHFLELAFLASLAAFTLASIQKRRIAARCFFLLALIQWGTYAKTWEIPATSFIPQEGTILKILAINVYVDHPDIERLDRWISAQAADLVILSEYTSAWLSPALHSRAQFPFKIESASGVDGLAIWSRMLPLEQPKLLWPWPSGFPAMKAQITIGGRQVTLWAVHPSSPIRREGKGPGNPEVAALAQVIGDRSDNESTLVIGDLNLTEASPLWHDLLHHTRLRDSRAGFGRQVSWPDWLPYKLPLDHVLLSQDWIVLDRRIGPSLGSDHRPVLITLALRPAQQAKIAATSGFAVPPR